MNDRYLKLKDAIEVVRKTVVIETLADKYIESSLELRLLDKSLTADVRKNVRGEWLPHPNKSFREWDVCSACGTGCKRREYGEKWLTEYNFLFCPNCGAQMIRGEHDG